MWFLLPLILIGAVAAASSRLEPAPPAGPPGPIAVLGECVRVGQQPPPLVILCAIAEAQSIGRHDLASDIIEVFVIPVVARRARAAGMTMQPMPMPVAPQRMISSREEDAKIQAELDAVAALHLGAARHAMQPAIEAKSEEKPSSVIVGVMPMQRALSAPITGVSPDQWSKFMTCVEREDPMFVSSRHVGRFRQRKERLTELGIDPESIVGSSEAQREALDRDLADAHHHAHASGLADEHVGRLIRLPGHEDAHTVTLSGTLGVMQAAGLDGAVGWFENPGDRKRFPHTTAAFVRTNGVF